jgi:hypothetical protein
MPVKNVSPMIGPGAPSSFNGHQLDPFAQKDTTKNCFAAGDYEYNRLSPAVCAASSGGCTQSAVVNLLNTNGVHPNQSKPFVSGKPYVGDVDIPGPFGKDHVTSTSIFNSNGNQIGVRNLT